MILNAYLATDAHAVISKGGRAAFTRVVQGALNPTLRLDGDTAVWDMADRTVRAKWLAVEETRDATQDREAPARRDEPGAGPAPGGRSKPAGRRKA